LVIGQLGTIIWLLDTDNRLIYKGDTELLLSRCGDEDFWLAEPREQARWEIVLNKSLFNNDGEGNDYFFRPARLEQRKKMLDIVRTYSLIKS